MYLIFMFYKYFLKEYSSITYPMTNNVGQNNFLVAIFLISLSTENMSVTNLTEGQFNR